MPIPVSRLMQRQVPTLQQRIPLNNLQASLTAPAIPVVTAIVWYIGSGAGGLTINRSTSVANMVFTDTASGTTLPNDGTSTAGTLNLLLPTADTLGEVTDLINASSGFRMRLVASLRSTSPLNLAALSTTVITPSGQGLLNSNAPATLTIVYTNDGTGTVQVTSTAIIFTDNGTTPTLPNDGTSAAGTLTFSLPTADTLTELAALINASNDFTAVLAGVPGSTASTQLRVRSVVTVTSGTAFNIDTPGSDVLYLALGPEADLSLYTSPLLPNFAYPASSNAPLPGAYRDPNKRDSVLKGVGKLHVYNSVARLLGFTFNGGNVGANETPLLTIYDSSQTLDTPIGTYQSTNLVAKTQSWDVAPYAAQQTGGGEYQSTPGNRLVLVLTSPIGVFNLATLAARGVYGDVGIMISE